MPTTGTSPTADGESVASGRADASGPTVPSASGVALALAATLIVGCVLVGDRLTAKGDHLYLGQTYPIMGRYADNLGPGLLVPLALAVALLAAVPMAGRLPWRWLLAGVYATAACWAVALAVVGGGGATAIAEPLTSPYEYLHDVARIRGMGLGAFLHEFPRYLHSGNGSQWATQVAGHPPLATLVFVALAAAGLGGPVWAALVCVAGGAAAAPAVVSTVRLLAGEPSARAAAPFVAAAPAALWVATSADALFAGVAAAGVCALAHAAARRDRRGDGMALLAGVVLGACLYLSYGLVLLGPLAVAVVVAARRVRPLLVAAVGVAAVAASMTASGFWWFDGMAGTVVRMKSGGGYFERPDAYFAFANPAALAVVLGPAVIAALPLAVRARQQRRGLVVVPAAVAVALTAAMVSNLSKGEVERIWLPWAMWLLPLPALVPARHRIWLAAQLGWALLIAATTRLDW